jgi:hypothetical protein
MIKRLISSWYFVRAGDSLAAGDYALAFDNMNKAKSWSGKAYQKLSLFEINLRMAYAAKMCDESAIAIDEARKAKAKIIKVTSLNDREKAYLTVYCNLIERECQLEDVEFPHDIKEIHTLVNDDAIARRFKSSYPIVLDT